MLDTHRLEAAVAAVALGSGLLAALEEGGESLFIALPTTPPTRRSNPCMAHSFPAGDRPPMAWCMSAAAMDGVTTAVQRKAACHSLHRPCSGASPGKGGERDDYVQWFNPAFAF